MYYKAYGSGFITPKTTFPERIIAELWIFDEIADMPDGGLFVAHDDDKNYYGDDVMEVLKKLAPYVQAGDVEFTGEDAEHWRYHFEDGTVRYQVGRIVYEDKEV